MEISSYLLFFISLFSINFVQYLSIKRSKRSRISLPLSDNGNSLTSPPFITNTYHDNQYLVKSNR